MLIFGRKESEAIVIGDNVKVVVTKIRGEKVHIGIQAPSDVMVNREEIHVKIQEELRAALPATTGLESGEKDGARSLAGSGGL